MMAYDDRRFYSSIPLVSKETKRVDPAHGHWHYGQDLLSGRIKGSFVTLQPVHVGTGQVVPPQSLGIEDEAPLVKSFYRAGDKLTVPGSSLKGAIRTVVEAISYSAVSKTRSRLPRDRYGESRYDAKRKRGELDIAGKLFGAMGYQGHINVNDAPLLEGGEVEIFDIPPQYMPKPLRGRKHYPHHLQDDRERSWPLEIVKEGGRFAFDIHYSNCTPAELGLLLIPLGQSNPPLCIKIGAGKSAGLGAVRFEEVVVQKMDAEASYLAAETSWSEVDIAPCVARAQVELLRRDDALKILQADLGCGRWEK